LPLKAEFPAGASAKRAAIPAPNRSVLPKTMVQSEVGKGFKASPGCNFQPHDDKKPQHLGGGTDQLNLANAWQ
jgi:hypothetical protein